MKTTCRRAPAAILASLWAGAMAAAHAGEARADPVADFYRGKQITFVIGYTVGAAYDANGRLVARYLGRHVPGQPQVVVQNMPGAGSLASANHLYNVAPKDGTVIGMFSRGNAMYPLLEGQAQFDALKFGWIGSSQKETSLVLTWATTPFKTLEDIRRSEVVVGATGAGADSIVYAQALNALVGTKMRIVTGYPGNNEVMLAMERGEVQGAPSASIGTLMSGRPHWISERKVNLIAQIALEKHPRSFKDVPLAADHALSPLDRQAFELIASRQTMAYPVTAPPGVPAERLAALRSAFMATMKDAEFIADAEKAGMEVEPIGGEALSALVARIYASPPEAVARARAAVAVPAKK